MHESLFDIDISEKCFDQSIGIFPDEDIEIFQDQRFQDF